MRTVLGTYLLGKDFWAATRKGNDAGFDFGVEVMALAEPTEALAAAERIKDRAVKAADIASP